MKKKTRARRTPINSNVEKLDHMIDQSLVRKKNFKPFQNISNERALFEMIDTRIGHMLAKSCEIESKIEAIEKKRPKRKQNIDPYSYNFGKSTVITSTTKKKINHSPQSVLSVESTETEESIPQLQSASKFLLEENGLNSNQQSSSRKQKVQQRQEVFKQQQRQTANQNFQKKEEEEINFFQSEQDQDQDQDLFYQPKEDPNILYQPKQDQNLLYQSKQEQELFSQKKQTQNLFQSKQNQDLFQSKQNQDLFQSKQNQDIFQSKQNQDLFQSKQNQDLFQSKQNQDIFQSKQNQNPSYQPKQQNSATREVTMESLVSLIHTLAKEVHEMHEEQETLRGQIEELQEFIFSNE